MTVRFGVDEEKVRLALDFIRDHIAERGYPPSRREIAEHVGLQSASGGQAVIERLVRDGLIEVDRTITRGIRIKSSVLIDKAVEL